ncbi:hypothetical protein MF406_09620 [Georgenia sp. TF02-10]|uniref:hypothetical protein n=1 Tax=Georgenia sp. TF02-10 TaxID=2917725 RepID=UPI001FA77A56|nr:hypothetical protein [Georgenia sp. TF02-10]UNX53285.1 hypothetical protein MF406_09620 [Georgenia sp. TF02-10]
MADLPAPHTLAERDVLLGLSERVEIAGEAVAPDRLQERRCMVTVADVAPATRQPLDLLLTESQGFVYSTWSSLNRNQPAPSGDGLMMMGRP